MIRSCNKRSLGKEKKYTKYKVDRINYLKLGD